jgi:hypothetical protein
LPRTNAAKPTMQIATVCYFNVDFAKLFPIHAHDQLSGKGGKITDLMVLCTLISSRN